MGSNGNGKQKLALVFGNLPTVDEIDQFQLLAEDYDISLVSTESICGYLNETSRYNNLRCLALPDHEENPTYIPGLEAILGEFDIVVVKERLGLYAYQAVKSKWKHKFRLVVWADNLATLPAEDVDQMRTIRSEVTNGADAFLVQTNAAKTALVLEGVESERIFSFSPWTAKVAARTKKNRAAALEALGLPESSTTVAYFGQIEWEEGLLDLVAGAKLAVSTNPKLADKLKIVFCGIGSFAPQLKQSIHSLGIDDMAIFVAPGRDAFTTIMNAADCVYLTSSPSRDRVEGEPYRLVSAMTNEIPIMANRTSVIEEYCGKHRIDVCFASPDSIATAMDRLASAKTLVKDIVKKNAASVKAKYSKEIVARDMRKVFASIAKAQANIDPSSLDHQVLEVESLVASKQYLRAIDMIESIFKVEHIPVHHSSNLYRLIGDCFAKLSDIDSAKNAYIKAIEMDPYSAKSYIGLGTIGILKQSNDIAVIHFQKAVSLAPQDEMANLGLGLAFQGMQELDEAYKWVSKSLEINPENDAALYTLVKICYEVERYDHAETSIRKYMERHPHDYNMAFTLGGVLFKQGKLDEVSTLCNEIIKIDPMDTKAHALLKQVERAADQVAATSNV